MQEGDDAEVAPLAAEGPKLSSIALARQAKALKKRGRTTEDTFFEDDALWEVVQARMAITHSWTPCELDDVPLTPGFTSAPRKRDPFSPMSNPKIKTVWRVTTEDGSLGPLLAGVAGARAWAAKYRRELVAAGRALDPPPPSSALDRARAVGVIAYSVAAYDQSPPVRKQRTEDAKAQLADPERPLAPPPQHVPVEDYCGHSIVCAPAMFSLLTPAETLFPCRCTKHRPGEARFFLLVLVVANITATFGDSNPRAGQSWVVVGRDDHDCGPPSRPLPLPLYPAHSTRTAAQCSHCIPL